MLETASGRAEDRNMRPGRVGQDPGQSGIGRNLNLLAHRDKAASIKSVGAAITTLLIEMEAKKPDAIRKARRSKYLALGSKGLAA